MVKLERKLYAKKNSRKRTGSTPEGCGGPPFEANGTERDGGVGHLKTSIKFRPLVRADRGWRRGITKGAVYWIVRYSRGCRSDADQVGSGAGIRDPGRRKNRFGIVEESKFTREGTS